MKDIDCAVIGYDITDRETFDEAKNYWYKTIKDEFQTCKLICFIGNKKNMSKSNLNESLIDSEFKKEIEKSHLIDKSELDNYSISKIINNINHN